MARRLLYLAIGAGFAAEGTWVIQAWLLSIAVDRVFLHGQGLAPVAPWLWGILVSVILRAGCLWAGDVLAQDSANQAKSSLRQKLLAHLYLLGPAYIQGERSGELVNTAVEGIETLDDYITQYLTARTLAFLSPALVFLVILALDPWSSLVLLFAGPMLLLLLALIGGRAKAITEQRFLELSWMSAFYLDILQGLATLKMFGRSQEQADNIEKISQHYARTTMEILRTAFQTSLVMEWAATAATAMVALEVSLRLMGKAMEYPEALAVLILTPSFFLPLRQMAMKYHIGTSGKAAAKRVFEILDHDKDHVSEQIHETTDAVPMAREHPQNDAVATTWGIQFKNVHFSYGERPALRGLNMDIPTGKITALVGATGAGKSTVANLLLHFIEPAEGHITLIRDPWHAPLDGDNPPASSGIDTFDLEYWREQIAWVPQRPHLFDGSVADNIRLGKPDASLDEVMQATKDANAHDFIQALPQGYETLLGERGTRLSGGQRQRIAIARAFLKNAPLLILDEATSHLDERNEAAILEALKRLVKDRTTLVIAHRLRLAYAADQIVVLDQGRAVACGDHASLLESSEAYRRLVRAGEMNVSVATTIPVAGIGDPGPMTSAQVREIDDSSYQRNLNLPEPIAPRQESILSRLLHILAPFHWWIALAILLGFATVGASIGLMAISAYLISRAALANEVVELSLAITGVRFFALARAALRYAERYVTHTTTFRILTRLRVWFYRSVEPLAPARLQAYHSGDLLARCVADIETLENFYVRVITPPLTASLVTILACILLGSFNLYLGLALLVFLGLTGIALPLLTRWLGRQPAVDLASARAGLNVVVLDEIQGMADLLAYGQAKNHQALTHQLTQNFNALQRRLAQIRGLNNGLVALFTGLAAWMILILAIPLVSNGNISGVYLALLPLAAIASFEAFQPLSTSLHYLENGQAAAQRLFELTDAPAKTASSTGSPCDPPRPASLPKDDFSIDVQDVSFKYGPNEPWALHGLSFHIPSNGRMGILGPSGAGKTSLVNLLLRFWEYQAGRICIGGQELRSMRGEDVRKLIGVVSQDVHLFNASLRDNLLLANPEASEEEVASACHLAQLDDFIQALPDGTNTLLGENGLLLSGGQRQQVAIARAILKGAPILILDEATANLDPATAQAVIRALETFIAGRTTIIISHQQPVLKGVNQVLRLTVLENKTL
jgi:ATP-binding cassette subfamily C protein CydCD